jgi:hypothetical protein
MQHKYSLGAILLIMMVAVGLRAHFYQKFSRERGQFSHITYDAFGYYMYLPGALIYNDITGTRWIEPLHQQYGVKGSDALYQTIEQPDGRHVMKYLGGVALLQAPFFVVAHQLAPALGYAPDGFSPPYQWAIVVAAFFYGCLGLYWLRRVLLVYFTDTITAFVLMLVALATNWLQYVAVDGAMSHVFIFPLYALVLLLSQRWYSQPHRTTALGIGAVVGLATISRPTELIMLFIPLLWLPVATTDKRSKWQLVAQHRWHIVWAVLGGLIGIAPQLLYWRYSSGHWVFDVGSKWYFLNPWWRVLVGFEKGWVIYTPVALFMLMGLFLMKNQAFRRSVWVFCLLNLWIITAWADWRYGASYSCRALMQSYPVFALALGCCLQQGLNSRWRTLCYLAIAYLIAVNLFQIFQYNYGIIKFDENSFDYYRSVYLRWSR